MNKFLYLLILMLPIESFSIEKDSIVVETFKQNLKAIERILNGLGNDLEFLKERDVNIIYLDDFVKKGNKKSYDNFNTKSIFYELHNLAFYKNFNRYIEDTSFTNVIISGLTSDSKEVYARTLDYLFNDIRPDYAKAHSDNIKKYIKVSKFTHLNDSISILSYIVLTKDERSTLLTKVEQGDICSRALLGDTACIDSMIHLFLNETDYVEKADYANKLGYIGTRKCAIALLNSLDSKIFRNNHSSILSIRVPIIEALGRIHPENTILTKELKKITRFGDAGYAEGVDDIYKLNNLESAKRIMTLWDLDTTMTLKQKKVIKNYFDSLIKWGEETYKITLKINTEDLFLQKQLKPMINNR